MGMIEQEYKELRQLLKDYKDGKVTAQQVNVQIGIYSQMEKRQKNAIMVQALAVKANNNRPIKNLIEQNVIGNKACFDLTYEESEEETLRCPITEKIIRRVDCLDYSGSHLAECEKCHHFGITRKVLLDR